MFARIDEKRMIGIIEHLDDDGDETETEIPVVWHVCGTCSGKGTRVNPAVDGHGLTSDDFADDPDFADNYFGGMYDITCDDCDGRRVIADVSPDVTLTAEQTAAIEYANDAAHDAYCDTRTRFYENGGC